MAESFLQRQQRLQGARAQVGAAYQSNLGRAGSDAEIDSHLGGGSNFNPDNVSYALSNIANSEEANAYRNRAAAPAAGDPAAPAAPTAAAPAGASASTRAASGGMATAASAPAIVRPYVAPPSGVGKVAVQPSSVYTAGVLAPMRQAVAIGASPGFTQYGAPDAGQVSDLSRGILEQMLANPDTMGPEMVNLLKTRGKEGALAVADQLRNAASANVAGRGFSAAGGVKAAYDSEIDTNLINDLLVSNRDVDIQAAATNRADRLAALDAGSAWENGLVSRASENYKNRILGETTASDDVFRRAGFTEGQRTADNNLDVDRFGAQEGARQAEDASRFRNDAFSYEQIKDDRNQTLQEFLGQEGVNLDWARLDQSGSQFDAQLSEGQRQFNNRMGYDWAKMNAEERRMAVQTYIDSLR